MTFRNGVYPVSVRKEVVDIGQVDYGMKDKEREREIQTSKGDRKRIDTRAEYSLTSFFLLPFSSHQSPL